MTDTPPPEINPTEEWESSVKKRTVKDKVYETATTLTEPTTVSDISEHADCTKEGARPHLEWLVELGVLEKVADNPALFVRNEAYFEFRRITELLRQFEGRSEIEDAIEEYRAREEHLREFFDEPSPEMVHLAEIDHNDLDEAADRLSEWRTIRRRIRELQEAKIRINSDSGTAPASPTP